MIANLVAALAIVGKLTAASYFQTVLAFNTCLAVSAMLLKRSIFLQSSGIVETNK